MSTRGQYDQVTMLIEELRIVEAGGIPMRVTRADYDRIMAYASNFDQNRPCWDPYCVLPTHTSPTHKDTDGNKWAHTWSYTPSNRRPRPG